MRKRLKNVRAIEPGAGTNLRREMSRRQGEQWSGNFGTTDQAKMV